jgi:predicted nucleic acid-binding Zn ribbon protein
MEPKGPESIGEVVSRLFAARGWGRQQERLKLEQSWHEAVGAEYRSVTRVAGFRRQILEIEVNGAVPLQELSQFYKRRVLAKLRQLLPGTTITDLRFKASSW